MTKVIILGNDQITIYENRELGSTEVLNKYLNREWALPPWIHHPNFIRSDSVLLVTEKSPISSDLTLTLRQRQIMELLCKGQSADGIAVRLNISTDTVYDHLRKIKQRNNIATREELIAAYSRETASGSGEWQEK